VRILEINKEQERVRLSMRRVPEDDIAHWIMNSDKNITLEENDAGNEEQLGP